MPKVFVSATTRDLKSYRAVVAEWARAKGYDPVVQDEFPVQSDYGTILQMLREKLDPCDAVIHLAGLFYGFEPTNRPDGETRRSYTQLEYELGKEHKRQVFRFIASESFQADQTLAQIEAQLLNEIPRLTSEEFQHQCALQIQHRQRLTQGNEGWSPTSRTTGNELYYEFSNHDELRSLLNSIEIKSTLAKPQNLPLVGSLFKGRDEFIEQLRSVLTSKPTHIAAVTAKQAIHGLGGVGKTRVAVEYAKRFGHEYTALLFITADSPSNMQRNLANLCGALVLNLPEKDARELEVQVAAALRWLREHSGWFLIVDNVDTPEAAGAVEGLLQQLDTGHTVVTSRLSQWGDAVEELSLDVINESAATDLLLERTNGKRKPMSTDAEDAKLLSSDLGRLPLALEQAGAFIAKHRGSIQEYRTRWKHQEQKVVEWHDQRSMKYPASIATTWQTSFDQLSADGRGLLNVFCWLGPDPIPLTMIQKLSAEENEHWIDVETGLAELADYSLVRWATQENDFIEIHRLVADIARYRVSESSRKGWLCRSLRMVNDFVPSEPPFYDVRSWPTSYDIGQSHMAAIVQHADESKITAPTRRLMQELGGYFLTRAEFAFSEPLLRRALAISEQELEPGSPYIAKALNELASLFLETDRSTEAEPLLRRALEIQEQYFEPVQLFVATALNNLASLLQQTNRLAEAEILFRRALAIYEQSDEPEHPQSAHVLNNLGSLLMSTNRQADAEPVMRRALTVYEKSFGPAHPYVAKALHNLALLFKYANRHQEAEPLFRRALAIDEKSFGSHPEVAKQLTGLALFLTEASRQPEAEPLFRRALAINEHSYGTTHTEFAKALNRLASLLHDTNQYSEAEPLFRRALTIYEQSRDPEDPYVAHILNNLAVLLNDSNRHAEAEPLLRHALAINEKACGSEHTSGVSSLFNLARLLIDTNRHVEAEPVLRRAIAINEKSCSPTNVEDAKKHSSLAELLQATNRLAEAEPLFRRALAIYEQTCASDQPHVANAYYGLAKVLHATNRLAEAEPLYRRALAINEKSFGSEHLEFARSCDGLASLLKETNRHAEAEPLFRRVLTIYEQSYGAESPFVASGLTSLALLLKAMKRLAEAEPLFRRALAIDEQAYGAEHPYVATHLNNLALLFQATNRLAEAEPLFRRALAIDEQSDGAEYPNVAVPLSNLGELLRTLGRLDEAEPLLRRAMQLDTASFGENHPNVAIDAYKLAMLEHRKHNSLEAQRLLLHSLSVFRASYSDDSHPRIQETLRRMHEIGMSPPE